MSELNRRDFLKVLGISGTASACSITIDPVTPIENVLPYVVTPDQIIPGVATWFATQCTACPAGCGVLAKNREGRIIKLEGNPDHPTNKGALCGMGQIDLQGTYSPDRFEGPSQGGSTMSWDDAMTAVSGAVAAAQGAGKTIAWLGRHRTGATAAVTNAFFEAVGGTVVRWEPLAKEALRSATRAVFGINGVPAYSLDDAHTIVSFGADFLSTWGDPSHARGYGNSRDPGHGGFTSQFFTIESRISNTSANADVHLSANPGSEAGLALALAKKVAAQNNYSGAATDLLGGIDADALVAASGVSAARVDELAARLAAHPSVVLPGGTTTMAGQAVAEATLVLNEVAGNIGNSVAFGPQPNTDGLNDWSDVESLLSDAAAGKIGVLFVDDLDIAYSTTGSTAKEALAAVDQVVVFANEPTESITDGSIVLPPGTTLEAWGDNEAVKGRHTLQQPAMKSIKDTRSSGDVLLALARIAEINANGLEAENFQAYLAEWWANEVIGGISCGEDWQQALQLGGAFKGIDATGADFQLATLPSTAATVEGSGPLLTLFPHPFLYDGRHANRPWAQEIPEPVSTNMWGTWAEIHPDTAHDLGLEKGDSITITTSAGSIDAGFFASPGIRKDVVAVVMGNGHEGAGRYADLTGANPVKLLADNNMAGTRCKVSRGSGPSKVHTQAGSLDQDHRPLSYTVKAKDIGTGSGPGGIVHMHHPPIDARLTAAGLNDMYPEPQHPTYRFAMAVDVNRCTGCGACEAACFAENNVPVVGPEQALRGRYMGWIRLSRYWEGSGETPDIRWQPVMCQQCSHAPCEGVCPVLATYHNLDGLNAMIYNRCVGTRYCANNCPYSARRFNYHTFDWPEPFYMMLNPDVNTRTMGVMEKCTFCIQRIRDVKDTYRDVGQTAPDSALTKLTACAAACPADALTFGNAKDPDSHVAEKFNDERAYAMLAELNTKPGVRYLARISHSEDTAGGHGGGH